jgi:hypothetical protein
MQLQVELKLAMVVNFNFQAKVPAVVPLERPEFRFIYL